jgi:hypothetical protein
MRPKTLDIPLYARKPSWFRRLKTRIRQKQMEEQNGWHTPDFVDELVRHCANFALLFLGLFTIFMVIAFIVGF